MAEVQDYVSDVELEGNFSDEEGDLEISESLSTTSRSTSVSSDFDSDDGSTDTPAESAARDTDGETSNLSETESDSFLQTDDEELVSEASGEQEAKTKIVYEARDILDLFGNICGSSGFIAPTRLQINNLHAFEENRSQYHRLSKYADFDKPRQWSECEICDFVTPVFDETLAVME